jgi:sugar lactone lactonase YvrE
MRCKTSLPGIAALALIVAACSSGRSGSGSNTSYSVGGTISGYAGSGLMLQDNGAGNATIAAGATSFSFAGAASGAAYKVTVAGQPSGENCTVTGGSGTVSGNVTNIAIACSPLTFSVGGTISGYTASGLVLQNNGAGNDTIAAGATSFSFAGLDSGAAYKVTVSSQPSGETCSVTGGSGTVSANVANIDVACTPGTAPPSSVATTPIGGTAVTLTLPPAGPFSGTLNVPATVGKVSATLTVQLSVQLSALTGKAAASNLPSGAAIYVTVSTSTKVQFATPVTFTLTDADGHTYTLVPYILSASTATALGPPMRGAPGGANTPAAPAAEAARVSRFAASGSAPWTVSLASLPQRSGAVPQGSGPTGISYSLPPPLMSASYGSNSLILVGNLGGLLGAYPTALKDYNNLPALAAGDAVVMPEDGSNAIRIFAAGVNGAVAPFLVPQITTAYSSGASPNLCLVQVDEKGTVYALDPYNLTLFSWAWGSTQAPSILVSELPAPGATSLVSVVSFAVNPQGTLVAVLARALDSISYVLVYDIASKSVPQLFQVSNSEFPTQTVNLAMDAAGQIYYTDGIQAYVYAAGATGAASAVQTLMASSTLNPNEAGVPNIEQLLVQTTSSVGGDVGAGSTNAGGLAGTIFAVTQGSTGGGDVFVDSFYPPANGAPPNEQDITSLGLICPTCDSGYLNNVIAQTGAGTYAGFSVGAADFQGNLYLYNLQAAPDLQLTPPAVEVFGSLFSATPGDVTPRAFSDSVSAFPASAFASIALVPESIVTVTPATLTVVQGASATVTVSESGYTGAFTPGACSVATLTAGAAGSFSVLGSSSGTCTVAFRDSAGRAGTLAITVTGSTTVALSAPGGLAINPLNGNLYVANSNQILIYSESSTGAFALTQVGTITSGIASPSRVTFDTAGNLYVTNADANTNTVTVYTGGSAGGSPIATISKDVTRPLGIAVDTAGKVFVANNDNGTISVYTPNTAGSPAAGYTEAPYSPISKDAAGNTFAAPGALYFVNLGSFGSFVLVALGAPNEILAYSDAEFGGTLAPVATLTNGVNGPTGITFSGSTESTAQLYLTNLYANSGTGNAVIYSAAQVLESGTPSPTATITSGVSGPEGIAVDAAGRIFVSNSTTNTITVYAPGGAGAPIYTLGGSATGACNAAPAPSGGGAQPYDNQSYCASFTGQTDMLYTFTGTLTFTTPAAAGNIIGCQYASSGTISAGGASTTTPATPCTGTVDAAGNLQITSASGNGFTGTFSSDGSTVSGTYSFGDFGPGGGVASGNFSGTESQ